MILDFDEPGADSVLDADVCIVGAGAAGITLALEFLGTGHTVLVVESGGERHEERVQELSETDCDARLLHRSLTWGRPRVLGGATTLWAGLVMPLDELDFRPREWVPAGGWPFELSELAPYYRRAERLLGLEPSSYREDDWPARSPRPPTLKAGGVRFRFSRFSPALDLGRAHRPRLASAPNVTVLLHASAVRLVADENGVERVELASLNGRRSSAIAGHFVLCCGAVEAARLLLASRLGNGLVGRYFQEHAHVKLPVLPADRSKFQRMFNTRRVNGARYYPKLAASPELQQAEGILNVCADVRYDFDPDSAVESAKLILRGLRRPELRPSMARAARNVASRPHELVTAAYRRLALKHRVSEDRGPISFSVQCEALPDADNRVTLGSETDALGIPRAVVRWRLSELERRSLEEFSRTLAEQLRRHGLGELDLSPYPLPDDPQLLGNHVAAGFHQAGTTRMDDDPARGVVDRHCRVHGIRNLHVGSAGVFPAGGYANPTLTIMALCVRLADRLKGELAS